MRVIVVLCLIAVAAAQYEYAQNSQPQTSAAQLSEPIQPASEYNKEFYTYSAPPANEFEEAHASPISVKKSLRVLFIKAPESTAIENAALQLAQSAAEDRTAIYVLTKQADIGALASKLNVQQSNAHKPEVHFVKYRTSADAENAQRAIQSQYDSLPGASSSHDAGSAPVLNFASQAAPAPAAAAAAPAPANQYQPPAQAYLPPARRL
ncbi:uncharacterized protein LOC129238344 [Anastrepha obliqua]|uniref:uncharacterized protein LOC129238344 n=1 Tax=Anastrepha obliqua TaxID=95512 RepID=UPI002409C20E|nr:uncharacterized protein LOC129238344 [Anastrepha obliqua]